MKRLLVLTVCSALLAGCDLVPRGAALQTEVLAATRVEDGTRQTDFAVEVVTRENLATFLQWAPANDHGYPWISRVDQPNNRMIAAGDTLRITIWSTEDSGLLTGPGQRFATLPDLRVSPGGAVSLPYVNTVRVLGLSPERAQELIEQEYMSVIPSAQVQVELTEGRARTVSLVSGVSAPGSYPLADNDVTILQMIADGGGIPSSFVNPQVRLVRNGRLYGISADRLLNRPSNDTTLEGGDRIYIEEDDRTFLSLGAAGSEAVHIFPTDQVTALEALSIIGGLSDERADAQGILILRRYPVSKVTPDRSGPDHPRTVFTLDLTSADGLFSAGQFLIQPDDLVYVSESPLVVAGSILTAISVALRLAPN